MELLERDDVLDQLEAALRQAATARGRVVVISGPAGIGKTALLRAFLRTRCSGARILSAACDDLATPRPLGPLLDLAPSVGDDLRAALTGAPAPGHLFDLVLAELSRPPRPLVLVLDDVQWVDQATLDLLVYLVRRLARLPVLLVLASRDEPGTDPALRRVLAAAPAELAIRWELAPLSVHAVEALVGERGEEVHARTGGLPFYVRALQEHGSDDVPGSVRDLVQAHVSTLPGPARDVLELLAIDPTGVSVRELDELVPGWEEHAIAAEHAGLIVHAGAVVSFAHELAREAVLSSLPTIRRRQLHRRLLALLTADAEVARVVHHAEGAGDIVRLVPASLVAARAARRVHAHRQALEHYERVAPHLTMVTDGAERAAVAEERAEELLAAGRLEPALASLADAVDERDTLGQHLEVGRLLARRASYLARTGRHDEQGAVLEESLRVLEALEPGVERAYAYVHVASHHLDAWRPTTAQRFAERALELERSVGADDLRTDALIVLGAARCARGDVEDGLATLAQAVELAENIRHPGLVDTANEHIVDALLDRRRLVAADAALDRALGHAEVHEHHGIHGQLTVQRSRLLLHRGRLHDALTAARRAVDASDASPLVHWLARVQLAWALVRLGEPGAVAAIDDVTRSADGLGVRHRARLVSLQAEHAWLHDRVLAVEALTEVQRRSLETGATWIVGDLTRWCRRHGIPTDHASLDLPQPFALALAGDAAAARDAWSQREEPYEAAMAAYDADDRDVLLEALRVADELDARPLGERLRTRLRGLGVRRLPRGPQAATRRNPAGLTSRQVEVLRYLADGRTNAEIARELVLSVRTVDHHVSAILARLGVASRGDAVLRARSLGIAEPPPTG